MARGDTASARVITYMRTRVFCVTAQITKRSILLLGSFQRSLFLPDANSRTSSLALIWSVSRAKVDGVEH
jgi:hypothetical protein